MVTYYTSELAEIDDVSFRDFVMRCAPALVSGSTSNFSYFTKALDEEISRLEEAKSWTPENADKEAMQDYKLQVSTRNEEFERIAKTRSRYSTMLEQVQQWEPPTADHEKLKKFMVQQINESLKNDCPSDPSWYPEPRRLNGAEYRAMRMETAQKHIVYYTEQLGKEVKHLGEQAIWLRTLEDCFSGDG